PPAPQIVHRRNVRVSVRPGEVARAHVEQLLVAQAGRHRPFVERIRPNRTRARNARRLDETSGGRAVGDMQPARVVRWAHDWLLVIVVSGGGMLSCPRATTRREGASSERL